MARPRSSKRDKLGQEGEEPILRFGDWLVRRGLIDRGQLFAALNLSFMMGFRVGDALVEMRVLTRSLIEEEARAHSTFHSFARVC
jgi:hypothetical protein